MAEIWNNIIRAIVAFAVICIMIAIVFLYFKQVLPWIKEETLSSEEQEHAESNFDALIDNIEKCHAFEDNDCVCEGLPNFPGSFKVNSKLIIKEIANKKIQVNLTYNNKNYKNVVLDNIKISAIHSKTKERLPYKAEKSIDFSKEPPEFMQEGTARRWTFLTLRTHYPRLMTGMIYKSNDLFFIVDYKEQVLEKSEINLKMCGQKGITTSNKYNKHNKQD